MPRRPPTSDERDAYWMSHCRELAEAYRGKTSPNPTVGSAIVDRRGRLVADGVHHGPGTLHAEADALAKLGGRAPGATLYCTLEPCTHTGRTPPCTPAVIASGVSRVVVGSEDPFPGHGGGMRAIRRAGIEVSRALVDLCDRQNQPFLTWARTGTPMFTLKAAMTLDGKIATVAGDSQWITSEAARADARRLRGERDAILVGVGTVLADDPQLTARTPGARDPLRVVLDSRLRTPPRAKLVAGAVICTLADAPATRERALVARGARVWRFPAARGRGRVPIAKVAQRLGDEQVLSVLVEGGGEVHASVLAAGLADEVILYIAPKIVGGAAPSWVGGAGVGTLAQAYALDLVENIEFIGDDLKVVAARAPLIRPPRGRPATARSR